MFTEEGGQTTANSGGPLYLAQTQPSHFTDLYTEAKDFSDNKNNFMNTISQLERALRDETLANEELRNHVAILKDVIDKRLHKDGIVELL